MTPEEINPYAPPLSDAPPTPPGSARTGNLFVLAAGDATRFVLRHPLAFVLFSLGLSVPIDLVETYVAVHAAELDVGQRFSLMILFLSNVAAAFSWAALTELARQDEASERASIGTALLVASATFLTLLVCDMVVGVLVVVGAIFLLIPGLYLGMRFFFIVPVVVVERQSIWRSLQATWQFTESRQGVSLLFGALLTVVIAVILGWELLLTAVLWEALPWEDLPEQAVELSWLVQPTWRIPATLLAEWFTVMTFYGYSRLREQAAAGDPVAAAGSDSPAAQILRCEAVHLTWAAAPSLPPSSVCSSLPGAH